MQRYALGQTIVSHRAARQRMTRHLYFHHGEMLCGRKFPQSQQADRANARPEVEQLACCRVRMDGRPCGQQVIGGKPMAYAELKDTPVSGQDVQGDVVNHGRQSSQGTTTARRQYVSREANDSTHTNKSLPHAQVVRALRDAVLWR